MNSRSHSPEVLIAMPTLDISFDIHRVVSRILRLHRWVLHLVQISMFVFAGFFAFLLRFDFSIPWRFQQHLVYALYVWVVAKILVFHFLQLDRGWWRYVSIPDLLRLAAGNVLGSLLGGLTLVFVAPPGFPRSLYALDFLLWSGSRSEHW
jgi:FlaA1/EpsC-like NDP-sugar epimerase